MHTRVGLPSLFVFQQWIPFVEERKSTTDVYSKKVRQDTDPKVGQIY